MSLPRSRHMGSTVLINATWSALHTNYIGTMHLQVLKDLESDDFNEEMMDREYEEFTQMQKELADITAGMQEAMFKNEEDELLAIEASCDENINNVNDDISQIGSSLALKYLREHRLAISDTEHKAGPLVSMAALSNMRDFIHEQLRKTEESFHVRQQNLVETIERHRQEEEKRSLVEEKRKHKLLMEQEGEEAALREREKSQQGRLEEELKVVDDQLAQELTYHQAEIQKLSHDLEAEKTRYEAEHSHWLKSLEATRSHAALEIQRRYRGYRTRNGMSTTMKELEELTASRKNERYKLRVLEVEYQMKHRAEQDKKKKEEEAKKEAEQKKKLEEEERQKAAELRKREEEERLIEETRKEAERKIEEKRLDEERKKEDKKLEEERKKEEERQRKEEEKRLKEEEKLRKQEEKKRLEEEKKRQKEKEKKRKLEEKKKKEEEKKLKDEAEKTRKEEERKKELDEIEKQKKDIGNKLKMTEEMNAGDTSVDEAHLYSDSGAEIRDLPETTPQPGEWPPQQDSTKPDKPHTQVPLQLPTSTHAVASHSPRPPDHPPPHPLSTSTPIKATPPSPHPAPPPPPKPKPPAPPLAEQQPVPPHPAETQRLAWIKSCTPWSKVSNEPWKLVVQSGQKVQKRPVSAKKKLTPIAESVVLTAAHAETLRQVSSVTLFDLPGYSLSTLGQCWSLRYLTISHCHLVCLDGISQCKHLHYVNAEHNSIEYVDLKDLGSLQVARLANNKIGAIHGLDGCVNLRWLDVSHNNIIRLSGLSALRRLHTLNASYNQLVGCEGVEEVVTLQQLDLSHNFLQHFTGIDKLCLLTRLDLSSNNLLEVPELKNQVLLQVLDLQGNSIKSLAQLSKYCLPLLCRLNSSENMLESLEGLDKMILLRHLDLSLNQITELDSLTHGLQWNKQLENLDIEGNPVVEVYSSSYKKHISEGLKSVKVLNGNEVMRDSSETTSVLEEMDKEFLQMCLNQVRLHDTLREDFEAQKLALQSASEATSESVCHIHFSFCDRSFKMAAEHRSAHEYGYIETFSDLNKFNSSSSLMMDHKNLDANLESHESILKTVQNSPDQKTSNASATAAISNLSSGSRQKKDEPNQDLISNSCLNRSHEDQNNLKVSKSGARVISTVKQQTVAMETSDGLSDFSEDEGKDNPVRGARKPNLAPRPPRAPARSTYMSQKDKFNMAVQDGVGLTSESKQKVSKETRLNGHQEDGNFNNNCSFGESGGGPPDPPTSILSGQSGGLAQYVNEKDKFEMALRSQNQAREQVVKPGQGQARDTLDQPGRTTLPGVKADVFASQMTEGGSDNMFTEFNMDTLDDIDIEALDFDIDKYLEMGELDEFLESGWRPTDDPHLPQSSYPVLRGIPPSGKIPRAAGQGSGPPPQPAQAWNISQTTEPRGNNSLPFFGQGVVPPLVQPSPTPSTVASAAETIEGGSVRSKVDEIIEDWGFKDAHTAELMLARAKKMKYNTERKKKLSKLDPRQRLQLFRKLEESGRILSVRPPNVKTLPRKEYFQAREEATQRKELERRVEDHNRVGRTYEWIHTQVGDYPISSSRINPGPAPMYTNNGQQGKVSDPRKTSPLSDHRSSASSQAGLHQVRRLSLGAEYPSQSPSLPPIFKKDRLSFRDTPVEKSGGWGGGKKRSQRP